MTIIDRLATRIARWTRTYSSAGAVARAIEDRRRPDPDDLRRLGLDPWAFITIGHG
jgi:hypothetical protein